MNEQIIIDGLKKLYGEKAEEVKREVETVIEKYRSSLPHYEKRLTEKDVVLITYADTIRREGQFPLETLDEFLRENLERLINTIHILPFFPFSSDDGFAITDYYAVNPEFGTWGHIRQLSVDFRLMFDAVINHMSKDSDWFKGFLAGKPDFENFFVEVDENDERLKQVFVRERCLWFINILQNPVR